MKPRRSSLSLVGVLCVALLLELLVNRLGSRFARDLLLPRQTQQLIAMASAFTFHAASLLSVLLAALAILRVLVQPQALAVGSGPIELIARGTTVVAMVGFLFISVLGVWQPLPPQLRLYLVLLFALVVTQLVRGAWPATVGRGRVRVWMVVGLLSVAAHLTAMAMVQLVPGAKASVVRAVATLGQALAATAAVSSPISLVNRRARWFVPALVGILVAAGATAVAAYDWMLAARIAQYGFGMDLPSPLAGVALEALALGAWAAAAVALLGQPGPSRLRGWGLLVLGLSGYQLDWPFQTCSSTIGVFCLVESYLRERATPIPWEPWRRLVRRLAAAVGAKDAVVVGAAGFEEARAAGSIDGVAVEVVAERRGGMLRRIEIAVGNAPANEAPPLCLLRRGMPRLGRRSGVEVATGDLDFDATFVLHDARRVEVADSILDDTMRPRLRAAIDGWLGVWPGRGLRMRSVGAETFSLVLDEGRGEAAALGELLALLLEVHRRGQGAAH